MEPEVPLLWISSFSSFYLWKVHFSFTFTYVHYKLLYHIIRFQASKWVAPQHSIPGIRWLAPGAPWTRHCLRAGGRQNLTCIPSRELLVNSCLLQCWEHCCQIVLYKTIWFYNHSLHRKVVTLYIRRYENCFPAQDFVKIRPLLIFQMWNTWLTLSTLNLK